MDIKQRKLEAELSRLAAMVAQAEEGMRLAEREARKAREKLRQVNIGLEQMYITLDEPLSLAQGGGKPGETEAKS